MRGDLNITKWNKIRVRVSVVTIKEITDGCRPTDAHTNEQNTKRLEKKQKKKMKMLNNAGL